MRILGLHEASVLEFSSRLNDVIMVFHKEFADGPEKPRKILIRNVLKIMSNSEQVKKLEMPTGDGELLDFEITDDCVVVLIDWQNHEKRSNFTECYHIYGDGLEI